MLICLREHTHKHDMTKQQKANQRALNLLNKTSLDEVPYRCYFYSFLWRLLTFVWWLIFFFYYQQRSIFPSVSAAAKKLITCHYANVNTNVTEFHPIFWSIHLCRIMIIREKKRIQTIFKTNNAAQFLNSFIFL